MVHGPAGKGMERTHMEKAFVSDVRHMLREYYNTLLSRKKELEKEVDVYEQVELPFKTYWGPAWYWERVGTRLMAPPSVEDEIKFTKEELKKWSVIG